MTTLAQLEARVAALEANQAEGLATLAAVHALGAKVDAHHEENRQRFEAHGERFDAHDQRFDAHDQRFDALEAKVDAHDGRFDALERKADIQRELTNALGLQLAEHIQQSDATHARLEAGQTRLEGKFEALRGEVREFFRSTEESIAELKDIVVRALDRKAGQ
ncbi:hypothetical protein [Nocardia transvalensis]|uniref:hypothetical protein n=1 Tax=Nocardia transvalensis TaxID=37333 RepID=UPI001892DEB2|nr:hypothetical protein [Nocardia transvalensis]